MPERASHQPEMTRCSHCGQEIDDVAAYRACPSCGRSFSSISSSAPGNVTASGMPQALSPAELVAIRRGSSASVFALILYLAAIVIAIFGLVITYTDLDYQNKIVGGDAFNYVIFAARGAVWVGISIVTAIAALGLQIVGYMARLQRATGGQRSV